MFSFLQRYSCISNRCHSELLQMMNVDKYLERIHYNGTKTVSLENLEKICWCHGTNIPHDTLDLFGGKPKSQDITKIYENIVTNHRGGFCYEMNGLLKHMLEALGYNVEYLEGSCLIRSKDEFNFPFDHLLLKVTLEHAEYLVDVGYGAHAFFMPMKFINMLPQTQMTGIYRIRKAENVDNDYYVEKQQQHIYDMDSGMETTSDSFKSKYQESESWNVIFRFSCILHQWEDFMEAWHKHVDPENGFFRNNSFLEIFKENSVTVLWGSTLIEREFPDPLTMKEKRTELLPAADSANGSEDRSTINRVMKTTFGVELDFEPRFMSRNMK